MLQRDAHCFKLERIKKKVHHSDDDDESANIYRVVYKAADLAGSLFSFALLSV